MGTYSVKASALTVLLVALIVVPFYGHGLANEQPRAALAAALVEDGTVEISAYEDNLFYDYALKDGGVYSDKAPGSSVLFAPAYGAARLIGLNYIDDPGAILNIQAKVVGTIPLLLMAAGMAFVLRDRKSRVAAAATLAVFCGTMLLPFSSLGFGHVAAGAFGFLAVTLAIEGSENAHSWILAGLAAGIAVTVEYPMMVVAVAVLILGFRKSVPATIKVAAGGLVPAVLLLSYHWVAFGNPLHTPYRYAQVFNGEFSGVGLRFPDLPDLLTTLFGERGLFILTPIVPLAALAIALERPEGEPAKLWRTVSLGVLAAFVIIPSIWVDELAGAWGGFSPGPRFVTPAMALLAPAAAASFQRWPRLTVVASIWSFAFMFLALSVDPLPQDFTSTTDSAVRQWFELIKDQNVRQNVFKTALGPAGLGIHAVIVAFGAWLLWRATSTTPQHDPVRRQEI